MVLQNSGRYKADRSGGSDQDKQQWVPELKNIDYFTIFYTLFIKHFVTFL